ENATALALLFGDPQALAYLRKQVVTTTVRPAERRAAAGLLVEHGTPELVPLLHELLGDAMVRQVAVRGLASFFHETTPRRILARYSEFTAEEKQDAIATLASRKEYAAALLDAVERQTVPRAEVSAYAARQVHALGDPELRNCRPRASGAVRDSAPA